MARPGMEINLVIQHSGDAVANGEAQPQASLIQALGVIQAMKFLEYHQFV